jgi:predicted porin
MQKKIIALAVAGLVSGAAFAQTNVTVYGVADASFESASATGSAYGFNNDRKSFNRVNTNSSLIGFRGTESLGGGLDAIFQFESGANFDSAGALSLGRDSFVGLRSASFGTVRLGNISGPTRVLGANVDLNAGSTTPGANSSIIGKVLGGNAMVAGVSEVLQAAALPSGQVQGSMYNNGAAGYNSGAFDTRFTNSFNYTTPSFGGLTGAFSYGAGENRNLDSAIPRSQLNTKTWDIGAFYNNGPIYVGLTHGKIDQNRSGTAAQPYRGCAIGFTTNANTGAVTQPALISCAADASSITRFAGKFTFNGGHQVAALWERNKADISWNSSQNITPADTSSITQSTYGIAGKFMATPSLALIGQYYKTRDASISNMAPDGDTNVKMLELGAEYSLSKRTMLKAAYTTMTNGDDVATDFNVGSVGGGFGTGAKLKVWSAGLRHTF